MILSKNETNKAIQELVEKNSILTSKVDNYVLEANSKFVNVENFVQNQEELNQFQNLTNEAIENLEQNQNDLINKIDSLIDESGNNFDALGEKIKNQEQALKSKIHRFFACQHECSRDPSSCPITGNQYGLLEKLVELVAIS